MPLSSTYSWTSSTLRALAEPAASRYRAAHPSTTTAAMDSALGLRDMDRCLLSSWPAGGRITGGRGRHPHGGAPPPVTVPPRRPVHDVFGEPGPFPVGERRRGGKLLPSRAASVTVVPW